MSQIRKLRREAQGQIDSRIEQAKKLILEAEKLADEADIPFKPSILEITAVLGVDDWIGSSLDCM